MITARVQPLPSTLFTGRADILEILQRHFSSRGQGQHPRREFLLYGIGGAGKTEISLRFANENRSKCVYNLPSRAIC